MKTTSSISRRNFVASAAATAAMAAAATGTARADRNGYSITLQDNSLEMPLEVLDTIIDGIVSA